MLHIKSAAFVIPVLLFCAGASWNERADATGDWSGLRSRLEDDYGLHIDLDYTAETFDHYGNGKPSFRGNVDLVVVIDVEKLGMWANGTFLIYGQHAHGGGVSDELGLILPVSNLEAEPFTQLSEYWLYQEITPRIRLRLGKQDANRDFGNPRFPGNFVNSSFGVFPGVPMPSFPAPGLGAVAFAEVTKSFELRGAIYEGSPKIGSFGETAFTGDGGMFTTAAVVLRHTLRGSESAVNQLGVWRHTGMDRSGIFALYDMFLAVKDDRSVQLFVRGSWSPRLRQLENEVTAYVGGGITAHAFLGKNNTIGLGAGWAHTEFAGETFVEAFFKLREINWLTFEPDVQLFFKPDGHHFALGLRTKIKL